MDRLPYMLTREQAEEMICAVAELPIKQAGRLWLDLVQQHRQNIMQGERMPAHGTPPAGLRIPSPANGEAKTNGASGGEHDSHAVA